MIIFFYLFYNKNIIYYFSLQLFRFLDFKGISLGLVCCCFFIILFYFFLCTKHYLLHFFAALPVHRIKKMTSFVYFITRNSISPICLDSYGEAISVDLDQML